MSKLCENCGHPLPNAAGGGLYCTRCGEPVAKNMATIPAAAEGIIVLGPSASAEEVSDLADDASEVTYEDDNLDLSHE